MFLAYVCVCVCRINQNYLMDFDEAWQPHITFLQDPHFNLNLELLLNDPPTPTIHAFDPLLKGES